MISLNFASLETRKTHWAELHLAKTSGTLTRNKEKKLAIADRHIPSNDPRNHCGTHFRSSSLLDIKVAKGKVDPSC